MIIGTWNVQGISNKLGEVMREINHFKQDIIVLTETKKKGSGIEIQNAYLHLYSGIAKDKRAKRGVSVLIKKKYKKNISSWEAIDENMILVNLNLFGKKITILGVYAISEDEPVAKKDEFYNKLNRTIDEIGNNREIIMMGDFNARIKKMVDSRTAYQGDYWIGCQRGGEGEEGQ